MRSGEKRLLLDLGRDLIEGVLLRRPSARNRSPYVADVRLGDGREVIAHCPSLDLGGKCVAGARLLLRAARDKKGKLIGGSAVGKYGTPKCEFITQLVRCEEPENRELGGVWVGAHPRLGEQIAENLISQSLIAELAPVSQIHREVTGVAGCDMRSDFVLDHSDPPSKSVVEVKTVVDSDYDPVTAPKRASCVFVGKDVPYRRAAIFPWGKGSQKGPDGEKVVSARAIKHVRELTAIALGDKVDAMDKTPLSPMILFIVNRHDCPQFRANHEACPSLNFNMYLKQAHDAGVRIIARAVRWGDEGDELGMAFDAGEISLHFNSTE